jgi:hypothetical protein
MYTFPLIHRPCNSHRSFVKLPLTYRPRPVQNSRKICWIGMIVVKTSRSSCKFLIHRSFCRTRGRRKRKEGLSTCVPLNASLDRSDSGTICSRDRTCWKVHCCPLQSPSEAAQNRLDTSLSCNQPNHHPWYTSVSSSTFLIISLQHPTKRVLQVLSWFDYNMDLWVSEFRKPMAFDCCISMQQVYVTADKIDHTDSVFWN